MNVRRRRDADRRPAARGTWLPLRGTWLRLAAWGGTGFILAELAWRFCSSWQPGRSGVLYAVAGYLPIFLLGLLACRAGFNPRHRPAFLAYFVGICTSALWIAIRCLQELVRFD